MVVVWGTRQENQRWATDSVEIFRREPGCRLYSASLCYVLLWDDVGRKGSDGLVGGRSMGSAREVSSGCCCVLRCSPAKDLSFLVFRFVPRVSAFAAVQDH